LLVYAALIDMKRCLNPKCGLPNSDSAKQCTYCKLESFAAIEIQSVPPRGLSSVPEPAPPTAAAAAASGGGPGAPAPEQANATLPNPDESRPAVGFDPKPFVLAAGIGWDAVIRFVARHKAKVFSGTALGILLTVALSTPFCDGLQKRLIAAPSVIIIEPLPEELTHGKEGKLIAKYVNPDGDLPEFDWEPKSAFVGNTDTNIVTLDLT
jgi:hypothetical protein